MCVVDYAEFGKDCQSQGWEGGGGGGGALECNITGMCPFFKNLCSLFRKKMTFQYSVSELKNMFI